MVSFFLLDTSWSPWTEETLPSAAINVPLQHTTDTCCCPNKRPGGLMRIPSCIFGTVAAFKVHVAEFWLS